MSSDTQNVGERMAKIETQMVNITKSMDENRVDHKIIFDKLDKFIDSADRKYVSKTTLTITMTALMLLFTLIGIIWGMN